MSDSTTHPANEDLPPNVQITFRDDLTQPEQRRVVERSVATLVARSAEAVAQARAAQAEQEKLIASLNTPFMKLIEEDPAANKALDDLRTRPYFDLEPTDVLRREQPLTAINDAVTIPLREVAGREARLLSTFPPYHFSWTWFDPQGSPAFDVYRDKESGDVGFDARSGEAAGGADGFVAVHAGVGMILRTDRTQTARGTAGRRMRFSYVVEANGVDISATSEGGMEFTALEDGRLLNSAIAKQWRHRVSAGLFGGHETARRTQEWFGVSEPRFLEFPMRPGHEYTFNVGIWGFTDRQRGIGSGQAQAIIQANVHQIIKTP